MAINQTSKRLNLAVKLVDAARAFDEVADIWQSLVAQYNQAGTFIDAELEGSDALKHISAADIATLITRFSDAVTWLNSANRRDVLRKARL